MEPLSVPRAVPASHVCPQWKTQALCCELGTVCAIKAGCREGSMGQRKGPASSSMDTGPRTLQVCPPILLPIRARASPRLAGSSVRNFSLASEWKVPRSCGCWGRSSLWPGAMMPAAASPPISDAACLPWHSPRLWHSAEAWSLRGCEPLVKPGAGARQGPGGS